MLPSATGRLRPATPTDEPLHRKAARYAWALLLARIYEALPLLCPTCGGEVRIIAFITEAVAVRAMLGHLGEPTSPPRLMPAPGAAAVGDARRRAWRDRPAGPTGPGLRAR